MGSRARQKTLPLRTWGGCRKGAGRKPATGKAGVAHCRRPFHDRRHPVHVTLRALSGLPSLRGKHVFPALRRAIAEASRSEFRITQFSIQTNHVHLLVEAEARNALRHGLQGLGIRLAKTVNRMLGRHGSVWAVRYHARALTTPREVRNTLIYVLLNGRKHGVSRHGIDPCSSGAWFAGWRESIGVPTGTGPIARARTWLLSVGWRRAGSISVTDSPRHA